MKNKIGIFGAGLGGIVFGWYLVSPYLVVSQCKHSIEKLDADAAINCVDFPPLRESIKSELSAHVLSEMQNDPEMKSNPFASIGMALIVPMMSAMVDGYVTPSGIKTAFKVAKSKEAGMPEESSEQEEVVAQRSEDLGRSLKDSSIGYDGSLDKFKVSAKSEDGQDVGLIFNRNGFSDWKLTAIELSK